MTKAQIEVQTGEHENGTPYVKLVDAPSTIDQVPINHTGDGIIIAYAHGLIDETTLETICGGDCSTNAEDIREYAATIREHCDALDDLAGWLLYNEYRLTEAQCAEWHKAASDGMYERNPYDGEWQAAIDELTELRNKWSAKD